jgi:N-acetylmuramic acid 6-phosphate etherase
MATEEVDPRFADLDAWQLSSAMEAMWEGQLAAIAAIGPALPSITAATEAAKCALGDYGRINTWALAPRVALPFRTAPN